MPIARMANGRARAVVRLCRYPQGADFGVADRAPALGHQLEAFRSHDKRDTTRLGRRLRTQSFFLVLAFGAAVSRHRTAPLVVLLRFDISGDSYLLFDASTRRYDARFLNLLLAFSVTPHAMCGRPDGSRDNLSCPARKALIVHRKQALSLMLGSVFPRRCRWVAHPKIPSRFSRQARRGYY
jgi:hypothetical protein